MSKPDLSFSWSVYDWNSYEVGQKIISDPVVWQGFKWALCCYPNGTVAETAGKVGCFITVKSLNSGNAPWALDVTFALSICERPPAKATCSFRNDADIWGFKDIMSKDALDETKPISAHAQIFLSKFPAASSLEPPAAPKHPLLSLSQFFDDQATSDVVLKCGDKTFNVHKIILIATSEYFAAMWRKGAWKEGSLSPSTTSEEGGASSSGPPELEVTDCEPQVLEHALQYIYKGEQGLPTTLTWNDCCELLEASSFFQMPSLQEVLVHKLSSLLAADNLVLIYVTGKKLGITKLSDNVLDFVKTKYGSIRDQRKAILSAIKEGPADCEELLDCLIEAAEQFAPQSSKKVV